MFNWVKNIVVNYAVKLIKKEIDKVEEKNPEIKDFRYQLYRNTNVGFISWGINTLEKGSEHITPIQLFKKRLEPLRDDVEGIIIKIIDGLAPGK